MLPIHRFAAAGDVDGVVREIGSGVPVDVVAPATGFTPLMAAVQSLEAGLDIVRVLVEHGANVNALTAEVEADFGSPVFKPVLSLAVGAGDLEKVRLLLDCGANLNYRTTCNFDVLIDAISGGAYYPRDQLLPLVNLLVERGAALDNVGNNENSALRIAARDGRLDAVRLLLAAGADASHLGWSELHSAVALGSLEDVERALGANADLEVRDWTESTPWMLGLVAGDLQKLELLAREGAPVVVGSWGRTSLMHAAQANQGDVVSWLIQRGHQIEAQSDSGDTALQTAVGAGATDAVRVLLDAGAKIEYIRTGGKTMPSGWLIDQNGRLMRADAAEAGSITSRDEHFLQTDSLPLETEDQGLLREMEIRRVRVIRRAYDLETVRLLVSAGASLRDIDDEVRVRLIGLGVEELECSLQEYEAGKYPRFGVSNPEKVNIPFWNAMVRSGTIPYYAREKFEDTDFSFPERRPVWCFQRMGMSITELPDGRIIEIGGEHEDSSDPDFCIYNDVVVHHGGGRFDIYIYPESVFPPTDFHSATSVGDYIYVIGSFGYPGERFPGRTPVYRLNVHTLCMERFQTAGEEPGWIRDHRARLDTSVEPEGVILVQGGTVLIKKADREIFVVNQDRFLLSLRSGVWSRLPGGEARGHKDVSAM